MTSLTSNRVLLVDDEPGMLQMLKTVLRQYGFVTEEAGDGRDAMELLGKRPFDVIVSDVNMPRYPGLEFLRSVREKDPDIPVIMMTGIKDRAHHMKAQTLNVSEYLVKNEYTPRDLLELIRKHIAPLPATTALDVLTRPQVSH